MNNLLAHQQAVFQRLEILADIFFNGQWRNLPIKPRLHPLIVGPTGSGKSHIVRALAEKLKLPLYRATYGGWIVAGGRGQPTIGEIQKFMLRNETGIIHLDEADKFCPPSNTEWTTSMKTELFNLLDGTISEHSGKFLIIGSGTWQDIWEQSGKEGLGFNPSKEEFSMAGQTAIPTELLFRFNSDLLMLSYPTADEVVDVAQTIHNRIPGVPMDAEQIRKDYTTSGKGARFLEEYTTRLLVQSYLPKPDFQTPFVEDQADYDPDEFDVFGTDDDIPLDPQPVHVLEDDPDVSVDRVLPIYQRAIGQSLAQFADMVEGDDFYRPGSPELEMLVVAELEKKFAGTPYGEKYAELSARLPQMFRKYQARV